MCKTIYGKKISISNYLKIYINITKKKNTLNIKIRSGLIAHKTTFLQKPNGVHVSNYGSLYSSQQCPNSNYISYKGLDMKNSQVHSTAIQICITQQIALILMMPSIEKLSKPILFSIGLFG